MKVEITFDEIEDKIKNDYVLIDIRDEDRFKSGNIPNSINLKVDEIYDKKEFLDKELFLYCVNGTVSYKIAKELQKKGFLAYSISGGYVEWVRRNFNKVQKLDKLKTVEKSIQKKFHEQLFSKFCKAINTYNLIDPNDKIAVCISGGKDSILMAKLFQELKKHNKIPFELVFLVMDPGYSSANREVIEKNAEVLNIPITVFETNIFQNVYTIPKSPCYVCARMRRGYLYSKAKELGCNKIALGHHYDDVIETTLMSMLYGGQIETMLPKLHSENFEGMELIRPMYLIRERDIIHWRDYNEFYFIQCACKFTDNSLNEELLNSSNTGSKRKKVKQIIENLVKEDPQVEKNIFKCTENVNLGKILSYKDLDGIKHNFIDEYKKI